MAVQTPLIFGEQTEGDQGRPSVEVPIDADRHPVAPETIVKGMISHTHELFTASRFHIFGDHAEALTYCSDPVEALSLLPGQICEYKSGPDVEILDGLGKTGETVVLIENDDADGGGVSTQRDDHPTIRLNPGSTQPTQQQMLTRFRSLIRRDSQIEVQLSRQRGERGPEHLMVTGVWVDDQLEEFFQVPPHLNPRKLNIWGYPCRTSPEEKHAGNLFSKKKYKRLLSKTDHTGKSLDGVVLSLTQDHINRYDAVIRSYQGQHDRPGGDVYLLSRAASGNSNLAPEVLIFVNLDRDSSRRGAPSRINRTVDVYPTMMGRRSYRMSPRALAQAQRILPVSRVEGASPADRFFGYVTGDTPSGAREGDVSSKGCFFFGAVDTDDVGPLKEPHRPAPLLAPKLSSAGRSLTARSGATSAQEEDQFLPRSEYYSEGQFLGAAVYPAHRELVDSQSSPEEKTRNTTIDQSNKKIRMTAESWVTPGFIMRCRIRFEDLANNKLTVLVWLLTPENLVPASKKGTDHMDYLRMGLGKPCGLGILEVRFTEDGLRAIRAGGDSRLAAMYRDLGDCLSTAETVHAAEDFILDKEGIFRKTPWIQTLQRAAFSYSDGRLVRYISLEENRSNNHTDLKTGRPQPGCGVAPWDMFGDGAAVPLEISRSKR